VNIGNGFDMEVISKFFLKGYSSDRKINSCRIKMMKKLGRMELARMNVVLVRYSSG
jgi:hypothetical protein